MADGKTTIELTESTADDLYRRKSRGDSYDDVVRRLLALAVYVESDGGSAVEILEDSAATKELSEAEAEADA